MRIRRVRDVLQNMSRWRPVGDVLQNVSRWWPVGDILQNVSRRCLAVGVFVCAMGTAWADPLTVFYYPCGVQAGTTNRIIVGGQHLGGLRGGWVSGAGVEILDVQRMPGFPLPLGTGQGGWVHDWLEANLDGRPKDKPKLPNDEALRGWTRFPLWELMDQLDSLELSLVASDHYSPRDVLQMSPALSEMCILTVAAASDAAPGVRDVVLYDNGSASAPHAFFVTKHPHVPEPLFESPVRRRIRLAEREKTLSAGVAVGKEPGHEPPVVFDGQVMPGETDSFRLHLRRGTRLTCALTARELLPYLGDAVPGFFNPVLHLKNDVGHEVALADDYFYLPDPVLTYDVPTDGDYVLEVHDNVYRGRKDFVYAITCFTEKDGEPFPTPQARAFECFPPARAHKPSPAVDGFTREGVIDMPGRTAAYAFEVKEPGTWQFELFARRMGSPLDGELRLQGPLSDLPPAFTPQLARWDDVTNKVFSGSVPQVECDPIGTYAFTRAGRYRIVVADTAGNGGDDYTYTLRAAPAHPTFEVYAVKSSFLVRPWHPKFSFKARIVRRNGFRGVVAFDETEDVRFERGTIPADKEEAEIVAVVKKKDGEGMLCAELTASAVGESAGGDGAPSSPAADGPLRKVPVTPGDPMEQAFAYTHLLPARCFHVYSLPGDPSYAWEPTWIDMPKDRLFPPHVIFAHTNMPPVTKSGAGSLDYVAAVDVVPVAPAPTADAEDGVFALKFASSAANTVGHRGVVAFEPSASVPPAAAVCAALAGVPRFVSESFIYVDGDARRVRTLARAASLPLDGDALVYVSSADSAPLAGNVGAAARRLRDAGWCFDFATDKSLPAAPRAYRAVYVPKSSRPMPEATARMLTAYAEKNGCTILFEEAVPAAAKTFREALKGAKKGVAKVGKGQVAVGDHAYLLGRDVKPGIRLETFAPEGVRFARYGTRGGEGWYFVHNATRRPVAGNWRFNMRGRPRTAYLMNVDTGKISALSAGKDGSVACSLGAGESAWINVSGLPPPPPGAEPPKKRRW